MRKRLSTLHAFAPSRPPGYVDDVLLGAKIDGEWYELTDARWAELCRKYRPTINATSPAPPPPAPVQPLAYADWPLAVKMNSMLRGGEDSGLGDTVARWSERMGAAWGAKKFEELTGRNCGCANRQAWLNARYPYAEEA